MSNENTPSKVRESGSGPRARPSSDSVPKARYGDGDVIASRYTLGRRLGEGGMGEVWLAHDRTLDIDVAIKLIRAEDETTTERADRLLTEARAAARLGSPSIVRVMDFGKTDRGDPFIVMELLEGEDLAEALSRRGRLSPIKAVRTLLPIINALALAHTKGIIHRDLKPENIYLAQADEAQMQPKLVDFGVAKLEAGHAGRLTQTGELMGSPLYMSPEQARGDDVDYRADVWSMGVVLYEVLTGAPPFEGKNYNAVLYSIIANPATPIMERGVDEPELWALIAKAIDKVRDQRWFSMRDFGEALARWLEERGITEDITGASLHTTWFNWGNKDAENQLDSGPPGPPSSSRASPAIDIPPPPLLPGRTREITIKTARSGKLGTGPIVAIGVAITVLVAAVALSLREETAVQVSTPTQAPAAAPTPPAGQETRAGAEDTSAEVTVTDEASGEMTGVFVDEPALDPAKLPMAHEAPAPAPAEPRRAFRPRAKPRSAPAVKAEAAPEPAPAPRAKPKGNVSSSGIVVKDPY